MPQPVNYRDIDLSGLIQNNLVPPPAGLLVGDRSAKRLAALWSLACCIRVAHNRDEQAYVVRDNEIKFTIPENGVFPIELMVEQVAQLYEMSEDDQFLVQDLVASKTNASAYQQCYEWTKESKPHPISLPDLPQPGSEVEASWLRVLGTARMAVIEKLEGQGDSDGSSLEDLTSIKPVSQAEKQNEADPGTATETDNHYGQPGSCNETAYNYLQPNVLQKIRKAIAGDLTYDLEESAIQSDIAKLHEDIDQEILEIANEKAKIWRLNNVLWALRSERMPLAQHLAWLTRGYGLKFTSSHTALWSIMNGTTNNTAGVTDLWNATEFSLTYRKYYPQRFESLADPNYVPDIDEVLREVNNMVIEEIIHTGNFDHKDARSSVPLTRDEIITEIKRAAEAPESLVSLLTAGVAKIQLIADKFVSGSRPLEKTTVESLRVDHRATNKDPVDSDVHTTGAPASATKKVAPSADRAEELRKFRALMEDDSSD